MAHTFNWHNIPPSMRLGSHSKETITLYRGFRPHQISSAGMLSSAVRSRRGTIVDEVKNTVEIANTEELVNFVSTHADNLEGVLTPFVSTSTDRTIAERFAKSKDGLLATLAIPAERLVVVPMLPFEVLALGYIGLEEIMRIVPSTVSCDAV